MVFGNAENNPPMYYLTGGGHVSAATLIKKRDEDAVLYCNDMERDEAAKSGLKIRLYSEYPLQELMKEAEGDFGRMMALRLQRMLKDRGLTSGRIGLYGKVEVSDILDSPQSYARTVARRHLCRRIGDGFDFLARHGNQG